MRPGVPWNVKGIEAEAREMAQLAARRNGVSLGDYLTQLIMTEGRGGQAVGHGYPQQQFVPGDGTYGPQPMPSPRFPQQHPQGYQQVQPQTYQPLHPHQPFPQQQQQLQAQYQTQHQPAPQYQPQPQQMPPSFDSQMRGSEFQVVAHGLRDLADRLEGSERRAQTAIATVNQSVAAMQDRIDAAERVKQLADVAFTSAADALAQSARDQSSAFENLETTMRSVQKRLGDIESGKAEWPGKDAVERLETALTQLQKRLVEMESQNKPDSAQKDQFARLEITLNHLQKRLSEMETARGDFPQKDALARLEQSIADVRHGVVDNEKRSRDDLTQLARFMRELSSRVEANERSGGGSGVAARLDALESRSTSMFEEMRGQLSAMDGRIAQVSSKPGAQPEAFVALKNSVDALHTRIDQGGAGSMDAIGTTLETLTSKIEDSERRAAESVATVSGALKAISTRIDESDKRQAQAIGSLERKTTDLVEDTMRSLTQRLEVSDKKHKDAISGLRLTVDGLVARAAADAIPDPRTRTSSMSSPLSASTAYAPPPAEAFAPAAQHAPAAPLSFDTKPGDGFSVSALETIMSSPLSSHSSSLDGPLELDRLAPDGEADVGETEKKADDFLTQARRAAQKAAQADAERQQAKGTGKKQRQAQPAYPKEETASKSRIGRLAIITIAGLAFVGGTVALLFSLPGSNSDGVNRPGAGESIGEMLNGQPTTPPAAVPKPGPAAEFTPPSPSDNPGAMTPGVSAPPAAAPAGFTSGTSMLPGGQPSENIAQLEAGALKGDPKAQLLLALNYSEGRGVEKDDARALSLVTKAAEQGYVLAQYRLGAMYERGIGVTKDLPQARTWYEKAAKGGNRKAMHNLAVLYADGVGIGQSFQAAANWFRQGAEYGLGDSQYNLAILLERGMGVEKNLQEAAKWYAIAAAGGDQGAVDRLEALKKTMPPADMAAAVGAAKSFKPKAVDPSANEMPATPG